jgi:hypothetical protein
MSIIATVAPYHRASAAGRRRGHSGGRHYRRCSRDGHTSTHGARTSILNGSVWGRLPVLQSDRLQKGHSSERFVSYSAVPLFGFQVLQSSVDPTQSVGFTTQSHNDARWHDRLLGAGVRNCWRDCISSTRCSRPYGQRVQRSSQSFWGMRWKGIGRIAAGAEPSGAGVAGEPFDRFG